MCFYHFLGKKLGRKGSLPQSNRKERHMTLTPESRVARLSSLVEIGKIFGEHLELEAILQSVHKQVSKVFDAKNFYVVCCVDNNQELEFTYQVEHGQRVPIKRRPSNAGLSGYMVSHRCPLIFQTPESLQKFSQQQNVEVLGEFAISWMGVPLIAGNRVVGAMVIQSYDDKVAYDNDDLDFFTTVATQVAIALQNAVLFQATSDRVKRLSVLLKIAGSLSYNLELEPLLNTVYAEVGQLFDTKNFYIATHEHGSSVWSFGLFIEHGEKEKVQQHSVNEGLTGFIIRTGRSLRFNNPMELRNFTLANNVEIIGRPPISWMGVPLIAQEQIVGVMAIQNYEKENTYDKEDLDLFATISSLVAAAVKNAQLFQKIATQNQQLEVTNKELKETQLKLLQAQKLEAIGQLAAGIAHEINTPIQFIGDNTKFFGESISTIKGAIDQYKTLLQKAISGKPPSKNCMEELDEEYDLEYILSEIPDSIRATQDGVHRVSSIVQGLKAFSHPDTGEKVLFNVNEGIKNTTIICRNEWKFIADLVLNLDDDLPMVPCFPGDFNQVIMNIIINGAHAISERLQNTNEIGLIQISTSLEKNHIIIRLKDNGIGMDNDSLKRIFDPFFTTKEVGQGTGQGLSISRNIIVNKHSGTLEVESIKGESSIFTISLPLK